MPPRKRAASAPKSEPEQEPLAPETEDEATGQQADADSHEPASPHADGDQEPDDEGSKDDKGDEPERSELQAADKPCGECFPNGWPDLEGTFSVGCTHGTYTRKQS